jgi:branched-chain amino acid transport system ATP-binding protein
VSKIILELLNLRKIFGGVVAVDNLTFLVPQGEIVSLIGPNGAGKTTIFNLITGFLKPTRGNIYLSGKDVSGWPPHKMASLGVARTFQNVQIFPQMTNLENVMVGRHLKSRSGIFYSSILPPFLRLEEKRIKAYARECLEFVGLKDQSKKIAGSMPLGGQRMLEFARALAMEPELLLLDEPVSGLNARETLAVADLINKIKESGITVVLVEHDMDLVMDISDSVIVINYGKRLAEGTPAEIQADESVISAYLGED